MVSCVVLCTVLGFVCCMMKRIKEIKVTQIEFILVVLHLSLYKFKDKNSRSLRRISIDNNGWMEPLYTDFSSVMDQPKRSRVPTRLFQSLDSLMQSKVTVHYLIFCTFSSKTNIHSLLNATHFYTELIKSLRIKSLALCPGQFRPIQ